MAKNRTDNIKLIPFKGVKIKWVKRAKAWCKTWFESNGERKQEWSKEKPTI